MKHEVDVLCVVAARPNFVKAAPILAELERRKIQTTLLHTGQHYDRNMSDVFFEELGMRPPDVHLNCGPGSHATQTSEVMVRFEKVLANREPDWVVVVGDVNSTLACALVTAKSPVMLAHVEAGLRSRDRSMPEEVNRVAVDHVSDLLLAPSPDAVDNLVVEGLGERSTLVGNVMIDSLLRNRSRAEGRAIVEELGLRSKHFVLLTLHRPSNVDDPDQLRRILQPIARIARRIPVVWPVHPRLRLRLESSGMTNSIRLIEPVGYLDSIALQSKARFVMTDSGGMQEETSALGVPCLTLRTTTERPITIERGTNTLVGTDPDQILEAGMRALEGNPYDGSRAEIWDGRAAGRIVDALMTGAQSDRRSA